MALEYRHIPREAGPPVETVTIDRHLYLTEDKTRVVPEGHPDCRWLWATPGMEVPRADAERLGAIDAPPVAEETTVEPAEEEPAGDDPAVVDEDSDDPAVPAEETKAAPKPGDKQRTKPGDKKKTVPELRMQATDLGVQVDNRWGEARLRQEIAAVEDGA